MAAVKTVDGNNNILLCKIVKFISVVALVGIGNLRRMYIREPFCYSQFQYSWESVTTFVRNCGHGKMRMCGSAWAEGTASSQKKV